MINATERARVDLSRNVWSLHELIMLVWVTLRLIANLRFQIRNPQFAIRNSSGGEGGIRTHGTVPRSQHFQCCQFNHSCTSPREELRIANFGFRIRLWAS